MRIVFSEFCKLCSLWQMSRFKNYFEFRRNVYDGIWTGQVKIPPARLPFDGDKAVRIHGASLWNKLHAFVPLRLKNVSIKSEDLSYFKICLRVNNRDHIHIACGGLLPIL